MNIDICEMQGHQVTQADHMFYTWKLRIHNQWNLLFDAIKFIEDLGYCVIIGYEDCKIYEGTNDQGKLVVSATSYLKRVMVHDAIWQFSVYYNKGEYNN